MKTVALCLLMSAFLFSCQEESSLDSAKENIWKKNTDKRLGSADANSQNADGDPTNAPIDGGLGILLVTGVAYGAKRIIGQRKQKAA